MGTGELLGKPNKLRGVTCDGLASRPGGVEILLAASCYESRDKLRPDEPVWLQGFTLYGFRGNFSYGTRRVVPSGQDGAILANHRAGFDSSCPLTEQAI